jgi:hypothetical protein
VCLCQFAGSPLRADAPRVVLAGQAATWPRLPLLRRQRGHAHHGEAKRDTTVITDGSSGIQLATAASILQPTTHVQDAPVLEVEHWVGVALSHGREVRGVCGDFLASDSQCLRGAVMSATIAAMASDDVRPGLSMPKRFTRPLMPWRCGPSMRKSAFASPGPDSFGRMPQ